MEKTHNGSTWSTGSDNVFVWDRTEIVQKRASDGSTVQRNYFDQGFEEGSNDYYYTKDHLGSIREVVASDGTTVESAYDYSPWGEVTKVGGSGVESDFLYTGHFYHDESDLHLTLYRTYDPALGMWLSRDPLETVTGELAELLPEGPNLYAYAGNSPVNFVDEDGLFLETAWDIGVVLYDLIKGDWGAAAVDGACALTPFVPAGAGAAGKALGRKSINQLNKVVNKGKAPKSIKRADKGKVKGEQDHVHFKDGSAMNKDGTFKHGKRDLTKKEKEFLNEHGFKCDK